MQYSKMDLTTFVTAWQKANILFPSKFWGPIPAGSSPVDEVNSICDRAEESHVVRRGPNWISGILLELNEDPTAISPVLAKLEMSNMDQLVITVILSWL